MGFNPSTRQTPVLSSQKKLTVAQTLDSADI
jgi:hypothetical protein